MNTAIEAGPVAPATTLRDDSAARAQTRRNTLLLGLLLLGTLLKGAVWALLIFPLDAPDEPSHFNYVMQVHMYRELPVIDMPAPDFMRVPPSTQQDPDTRLMLDFFGFWRFRGMPYESTQPPLYYFAAAVLVVPLGEDRLTLMFAARMLSVLLGVGAVAATWWAARALWPRQPLIVWGAPLLLTLHPQFTFVTSTITNDAAVLFFGALVLALWASGLEAAARGRVGPLWRWALLVAVATGLGLLAKLTLVVTLPPTLIWLFWLAGQSGEGFLPRLRRLIVPLVAAAGVGLLMIGPWVLRNLQIYGEPTGTRAIFDLYHRIYWRQKGFPEDQLFSNFPLDDFVSRSFRSFWALYGWMTEKLSLPWPLYIALVALMILALVGGLRVLRGWRGAKIDGLSLARRRLALLMSIVALFGFVNLVFYCSFVDYQPQGRYLFVALAPIMLLLLIGLRRTTNNPQLNRALLLSLPVILILMQIISIPILFGRWDEWAGILQLR